MTTGPLARASRRPVLMLEESVRAAGRNSAVSRLARMLVLRRFGAQEVRVSRSYGKGRKGEKDCDGNGGRAGLRAGSGVWVGARRRWRRWREVLMGVPGAGP